jgi:hypothetical protein
MAKYKIIRGKSGVYRAEDEQGKIVPMSYAMTAEDCEALTTKWHISTDEVVKEIEL